MEIRYSFRLRGIINRINCNPTERLFIKGKFNMSVSTFNDLSVSRSLCLRRIHKKRMEMKRNEALELQKVIKPFLDAVENYTNQNGPLDIFVYKQLDQSIQIRRETRVIPSHIQSEVGKKAFHEGEEIVVAVSFVRVLFFKMIGKVSKEDFQKALAKIIKYGLEHKWDLEKLNYSILKIFKMRNVPDLSVLPTFTEGKDYN